MLREGPDAYKSVNPTSIQMLQRRAIFSGLEIKRGGSGDDAVSQLGVWCCATFIKLARLCQQGQVPVDSIPSLPCWFVEGNIWRLYMLRRRDDDCIVRDLPTRLTQYSD
jgi:hypothetical protein